MSFIFENHSAAILVGFHGVHIGRVFAVLMFFALFVPFAWKFSWLSHFQANGKFKPMYTRFLFVFRGAGYRYTSCATEGVLLSISFCHLNHAAARFPSTAMEKYF